MQLRIVSDGSREGTCIVDVASGERVDNVVSVRWWIDTKHVPHARVELSVVQIDAIGEVDITQ